jgi:hypothetical protein
MNTGNAFDPVGALRSGNRHRHAHNRTAHRSPTRSLPGSGGSFSTGSPQRNNPPRGALLRNTLPSSGESEEYSRGSEESGRSEEYAEVSEEAAQVTRGENARRPTSVPATQDHVERDPAVSSEEHGRHGRRNSGAIALTIV